MALLLTDMSACFQLLKDLPVTGTTSHSKWVNWTFKCSKCRRIWVKEANLCSTNIGSQSWALVIGHRLCIDMPRGILISNMLLIDELNPPPYEFVLHTLHPDDLAQSCVKPSAASDCCCFLVTCLVTLIVWKEQFQTELMEIYVGWGVESSSEGQTLECAWQLPLHSAGDTDDVLHHAGMAKVNFVFNIKSKNKYLWFSFIEFAAEDFSVIGLLG